MIQILFNIFSIFPLSDEHGFCLLPCDKKAVAPCATIPSNVEAREACNLYSNYSYPANEEETRLWTIIMVHHTLKWIVTDPRILALVPKWIMIMDQLSLTLMMSFILSMIVSLFFRPRREIERSTEVHGSRQVSHLPAGTPDDVHSQETSRQRSTEVEEGRHTPPLPEAPSEDACSQGNSEQQSTEAHEDRHPSPHPTAPYDDAYSQGTSQQRPTEDEVTGPLPADPSDDVHGLETSTERPTEDEVTGPLPADPSDDVHGLETSTQHPTEDEGSSHPSPLPEGPPDDEYSQGTSEQLPTEEPRSCQTSPIPAGHSDDSTIYISMRLPVEDTGSSQPSPLPAGHFSFSDYSNSQGTSDQLPAEDPGNMTHCPSPVVSRDDVNSQGTSTQTEDRGSRPSSSRPASPFYIVRGQGTSGSYLWSPCRLFRRLIKMATGWSGNAGREPLRTQRIYNRGDASRPVRQRSADMEGTPSVPVRQSAIVKPPFVVAIDFGTTYSGYGFQDRTTFETEPLKIGGTYWDNSSTANLVSLKTPTSILFDEDGNFHSFGHDAEAHYCNIVQEGQAWNWYFFTRFKMMLYDRQILTRDMQLKDETGDKGLPALKVFTESIKCLKDHMLQTCKDKRIEIKHQDILWVLTVPAIWDDAAKQFMREAAVQAEIPTDRLLLNLEPEAASLFCHYLPVTRIDGSRGSRMERFQAGERYLILDVGGGTADLTAHEVVGDIDGISLKEIFKATGGDCGGIKVDQKFEQFLSEIIGPDTMEVIQARDRADYKEFLATFEVKKRAIGPNMNSRQSITLPSFFNERFEEINNGEKLEDNLRIPGKYAGRVTFVLGRIKMDATVLQELFDEVCDLIADRLTECLAQNTSYNIGTIIMVGGFSESEMLQEKVRKTFPNKKLIIPDEAGLSVLKGAVLYGHNPSMVATRVCKNTYGISAYQHFEPALDPASKRVTMDGMALCKDRFSIHATVGQKCQPDEMVGEHKYVPSDDQSTEMIIHVYTSTRSNPRYVDEESSRLIGEMKVPLQESRNNGEDDSIKVQFGFGDTELQVIATRNGKETPASFNFLQ